MSTSTPFETLHEGAALLPESFRLSHARLFAEEHLRRLAERLAQFQASGVPLAQPPPHFAAECTPPLAGAWEPFREPMSLWRGAADHLAPALLEAFAAALIAAGTRSLLLLLGQRLTPASITDERAFPPTRSELLAAAARLHEGDAVLTVAARALTKHVPRTTGQFWGEIKGSSAMKNERALALLQQILDQATWWNVFGHFQHELVYEARIPSGHGARWACQNIEFVGFLEPFDEEQCPSLQE
jgi:hypothetical protein